MCTEQHHAFAALQWLGEVMQAVLFCQRIYSPIARPPGQGQLEYRDAQRGKVLF